MGPPQGRAEGEENLPGPAGHTLPNTPQETIGLLGSQRTLLAHGHPVVHQHTQVPLRRAALQQLHPKPVRFASCPSLSGLESDNLPGTGLGGAWVPSPAGARAKPQPPAACTAVPKLPGEKRPLCTPSYWRCRGRGQLSRSRETSPAALLLLPVVVASPASVSFKVLSKYRSGKLPKAFKIIPALSNWEHILYITEPETWTAAAMYQATR